ncbi:unnamed protein product, partial [Closterium sp. Naga37s-1]
YIAEWARTTHDIPVAILNDALVRNLSFGDDFAGSLPLNLFKQSILCWPLY